MKCVTVKTVCYDPTLRRIPAPPAQPVVLDDLAAAVLALTD
jgi:hypothetical protein